jgi:hypothetical protein
METLYVVVAKFTDGTISRSSTNVDTAKSIKRSLEARGPLNVHLLELKYDSKKSRVLESTFNVI